MFKAYFAGAKNVPQIESGAEPTKTITEEDFGEYRGWIYPVPIYTDKSGRVFPPRVSDGFKKFSKARGRPHLGVDIMYKRLKKGIQKLPVYSKGSFLPSDIIPILAAQDGYIWKSSYSPTYGWNVRLDHGWIDGIPYNTFYQHMRLLFVPTAINKGKWGTRRFYVRKGEMLGIASHSPKGYKLNHLHYEVYTPTRDKAIDPAPILAQSRMLKMDDPRIHKPTGQEIHLASKPTSSVKTALALSVPLVLAAAVLAGEIDEYDAIAYTRSCNAV